ncbi:hypothetical protein VTP01DRAFT_3952 [Rhizomucor pusillus]|uniref:uncharacterized protein n=1 Tax=Rhizomucor pusillus TaxID=4840 RepID=UPI0037439FB6
MSAFVPVYTTFHSGEDVRSLLRSRLYVILVLAPLCFTGGRSDQIMQDQSKFSAMAHPLDRYLWLIDVATASNLAALAKRYVAQLQQKHFRAAPMGSQIAVHQCCE